MRESDFKKHCVKIFNNIKAILYGKNLFFMVICALDVKISLFLHHTLTNIVKVITPS